MIGDAGVERDIEPGLEQVLDAVAAALGAPLVDVAALPGGHSGVTLAGVADGRRVVVKATPPGRPALGRHDVLRQVRGMSLAADAVPIPEILAVAAEGDHPWFVMDFVEGEAAEPVLDDAASGDDAVLVRTRFTAAASILARLHRTDVRSTIEAGEPVIDPADELARWSRTLEAGAPEFRSLGERAIAHLSASIPGPAVPSLIHGDFRLGNLLFVDDHPAAVIDWEIWSLGDPRLDLGWFLTFCDPTLFPVIGHVDRRLPSVKDVEGDYGWGAGTATDGLAWFSALAAFKMGAVMAHNLHRHRTGRHLDAFQEQLPPTIRRLLARAAEG
jgi:aminoglycoside phosphotransferase (APT) family kinase protein